MNRSIKIYSIVYAGIIAITLMAIILNAIIIPKDNFPPEDMRRYNSMEQSIEDYDQLYLEVPIAITIDNYTVAMLLHEHNYFRTHLFYNDEKGWTEPLTGDDENPFSVWNHHIREQDRNQTAGIMFAGERYCTYAYVVKNIEVEPVVVDSLGNEFEIQMIEKWDKYYYFYLTTVEAIDSSYTVTIDGEEYQPNKWYYESFMWYRFFVIAVTLILFYPIGIVVINLICSIKKKIIK